MTAAKLIKKNKDIGAFKLIQIPGYIGIRENELAQIVATAHITYQCNHDSEESIEAEPVEWSRLSVLEHHRRIPPKFAPTHSKPCKAEEITWRRLQTKTCPHRHLVHNRDKCPGECPWCGAEPMLDHITMECTEAPQENIDETTT
ncbi:hypothetical protein HPB49_005831 [Dermacentor silvarum]|uniref:Uncharacterized protein n=1 Tax=Dermacentor silvarum TaxID=543639 RepID=A0ACB8CDP6_DERSI|nr:hypothetical protein HPB49_005831 [Dermacentor silvarum]